MFSKVWMFLNQYGLTIGVVLIMSALIFAAFAF